MRRSRQATWVALGLQFGLGSGCHRSKPTPQAEVQIVFAADQLGFLAPCGCSSHQLGGAARASAYVRQIAAGVPTLFVEGGNFLFKKLTLPAAEQEQAKDKAEALERSWDVGAKAAAARVAASGPYDLALGPDFMRQAFGAWPLLAAGSGRVFDLGGQKIGVLALAGAGTGAEAAAALRREGARLVVALVQGTMAEAAAWGEAAHADLALQAGVRDAEQDTDEAAQTGGAVPVFRVKDKGRSLLLLTLRVPPELAGGLVVLESDIARAARAAELSTVIESNRRRLASASGPLVAVLEQKIGELTTRREALLKPPPPPPSDRPTLRYEFVDLDDQKTEAPESQQIFATYTAAIGKKNLAAQAGKVCPQAKAGELSYVGVENCRECHAEAVAVYERTKHSHATQTLIDKGRQYDLDCVACHVLGFEKPGGVCRLDQVGARADVQCESCHGPGSAHADSAGDTPMPVKAPGFNDCYRCHDPENDTGFNHETYESHYRPSILGPGHGQPVAAHP